ncbi:tripartite tricarboxylate transporter substrate binding protein [Desulforamulus aquiferis]|uniref:Tripartite tricarboxylate transporter substrate binding protein n=1 Tax=Desulforamulus aquiferis TaxID=1397668 RepID=A0AAW7ZAI4_9FIRM|nr:tripartite tricarboxylate transporter substrate binding protein [Desulforamulus aquiferis]MDO7785850.1 tripartite tricarboxylate transporter substrate binding protein [Desulforamulus aquiferis]RYD05059.1 hypothetical protein N752_11425 [Desulforamulus aquiferis]
MRKIKLVAILMTLIMMLSFVTGCGQNGEDQAKKADSNYPEKPINMVIAFTAGGSSDVQARIMQKYWNKYVNQQWTFVYKTGAGGAIGFTEIANSKPDGYTIGGVNIPHMVLQPIGQGAKFKPEDFAYIAQVVNDPLVLAVRKDSKFKSVQEIIDFAKANPEKLKTGIVGTYTGSHLALLDFQDKTGTKMAQIVYKGTADQNAALLGGEIDVMMGFYNDVMRNLEQMTILGITTDERYEPLPDVPTVKELGIDIISDVRRGFVAPKGIGEDQLNFLRETFNKIANDPDYIADMEKAGQPHDYLNGPEFEKYVMQQQEEAKVLLEKFDLIKN